MKKVLCVLSLFGLCAGFPVVAIGQSESESPCASVLDLLTGGSSAGDVIDVIMARGLNLPDATVYAMGCVGDDDPEAIAVAGVGAAGNLDEAQSVADAVLASAGESGSVADAVQVALQEYIRLMPQPDVYEDEYVPTGGGRRPGNIVPPPGGVIPPPGGVLPPVSPAS